MRFFLLTLSLALPSLSAPSPPFFRATSLNGKALQILPIGDSITLGWKDPSGNGYRGPLYSLLQSSHANTTFLGSYVSGDFPQPHHEGHGGATSTVIAEAAAALNTTVDPNLILLHAGVNDAAVAAVAHEAEPIKGLDEVEKLMDLVSELWPRAAVLVARIIPCDPAEFDEGEETQRNIDAINDRISWIVKQRSFFGRRIAVVDMSHGPITAADLVDFAHPSPEGYAKMADLWFAGIKDVVARGWVPEP